MDPHSAPRGLTPYLAFLLVSVSLGPLLFGFHLAELNAPLDVLSCKTPAVDDLSNINPNSTQDSFASFPSCLPMGPMGLGIITSAFSFGGLLGATFAGPFSSKNGLIRPLSIAAVVAAVGSVLESLAVNLPILITGRWLSGLASGVAIVVGPLYIAELAPPGHKALYGSGTQIMVNVGIFLAQLLGYFFSYAQGWRVILVFPAIVAFVNFFTLLFTTESPRMLISLRGASRAAITTLMRSVRGPKADIETEIDNWKFSDTTQPSGSESRSLLDPENPAFSHTPVAQASMIDVLMDPRTRPAIFAVLAVMFAQQLCGINSIIMYGVSLLSSLLKSSSSTLNLLVSLLNIAVTTGCASLPDRLGRKRCILSSIAGMGISSLVLALSIMNSFKVLSAVSVISFVSFFALGLGPVPFILASELVGPEAVGATQSWAISFSWIATFLVAQFFPVINDWLGAGQVYFLFAFMAVLFFVLIHRMVPETM